MLLDALTIHKKQKLPLGSFFRFPWLAISKETLNKSTVEKANR